MNPGSGSRGPSPEIRKSEICWIPSPQNEHVLLGSVAGNKIFDQANYAEIAAKADPLKTKKKNNFLGRAAESAAAKVGITPGVICWLLGKNSCDSFIKWNLS